MKYRKSVIDDNWMVFTIEKDDDNHEVHEKLFEQFGIAYADLENKIIVIDGEYVTKHRLTQNHLLAIEAHEMGHYLADHKGRINKTLEVIEKEADWSAYQILKDMDKNKAASLIAERFENTYNESITEYAIKPSVRLKIEKFINETKVI